jgi:pimeloyl-ACP methyl ester carboxylesterase
MKELEEIMSYVTSNNVKIHYEVAGSGQPLLLAHGYTWDLLSWHDLGYTDGLKNSYQLVLIDSRGHGESDKPHEPKTYEMQNRVHDIVTVLDDLGLDKVHYLGWSRGGKEGFGMCKYAPDRLSSLMIISESPYKYGYGFFQQVFQHGIEEWKKVVRDFPVPETTKHRQYRNDHKALYAAALCGTVDLSDVLPSINIPTLLIVGTKDVAYDGVRDSLKQLPNATFLSLPNLDHVGSFAHSEITLPYIQAFLKIIDGRKRKTQESG